MLIRMEEISVTKKELKVFLGINFVMAINKLHTIAEYWREDNLIGNDKAFKMRPVIDHLNSGFSEVLSNDSGQSIDEHMVKFKGKSRMKQYIKSTPIKWGFKFWFRGSSKSGYLYQIDIYLGRKQTPGFNLGLGEEVVLQLTKDME